MHEEVEVDERREGVQRVKHERRARGWSWRERVMSGGSWWMQRERFAEGEELEQVTRGW